MKIQEIFQGMFKLISIMAQFLYLRRQTVEHPYPSVKCSLLVYWQIRYWHMYFWFSPSNDVYLRVHLKIIPITYHKKTKVNIYIYIYIYWDGNGNIFKFLKCSLHESLPLIPTMILIILFCSLKLMLQWWEFPQNINP